MKEAEDRDQHATVFERLKEQLAAIVLHFQSGHGDEAIYPLC
jgi:hypothetical protein